MFFEDFKSRYTTIPVAALNKSNKDRILKNDFSTLPHMHKEMEIIAVLNGSARFHIDSLDYDIKKGDVVLVSPYQIHYATIFANEEYDRCCICFDLSLLYDKKLNSDLENGIVTTENVINDPHCAELVKEACLAKVNEESGWEFKVIGNLSKLFGILKEKDLFSNSNSFLQSKMQNRLIINFVSENFSKEISSKSVADALHIDGSYFCRLFKANFGCNFQDYLSRYRIEKAKTMLKNSDLSVSEISEKVGFNSFSYFSKCFKEHTCMTPSEYRIK